MSLFGMPRAGRVKRTPLLVQGAEFDHLIPSSLVEMTARTYDVEANIFPGMGHNMMLEPGWPAVARRIDDWLVARGL
jgi:non-heme chloroperoxidase